MHWRAKYCEDKAHMSSTQHPVTADSTQMTIMASIWLSVFPYLGPFGGHQTCPVTFTSDSGCFRGSGDTFAKYGLSKGPSPSLPFLAHRGLVFICTSEAIIRCGCIGMPSKAKIDWHRGCTNQGSLTEEVPNLPPKS